MLRWDKHQMSLKNRQLRRWEGHFEPILQHISVFHFLKVLILKNLSFTLDKSRTDSYSFPLYG